MEVDPFEARLEFLGLLGKLNASQHSIQKVGNFAMRNRNLYEDLYSCIIEELEQTTSINMRMNIFYVLDSICHQSYKADFHGYMELIQRNLVKIIECVTPSGPKGNVNVAGTKKILETWRNRKLFPANVIEKVEKPLLSRELGANAPASSETGFSKDDILKRMDEDRERHKRIREEIWIRPADEDPEAEFLQNWDEVSDIDDVDYENMECENEKYLPGYPWILEFDRFLPSPAIFQSRQSAPSVTTSVTTNSSSSTEEETAAAAKRLTSPDGTIMLVKTTNSESEPPSPSAIFPTATAATSVTPAAAATVPFEQYHNGYQPSGRDHPRSQTYSHAYSQPSQNHQHSHPATNSSNNAHSQSHSHPHSQSFSRQYGHAHAYYDPSIPTGPAADSAPSSRKTSPLRRSSPPSSHRAASSPHPRHPLQ